VIELRQLYHCAVCGNVVEVLHAGAAALVCCGQDMELLSEKTADEGREKHVPVVERTANGVKVKVGDVPHPMIDKHYIQFIEVLTPDKVLRAELKPDMTPEAEFDVVYDDIIEVREYCNIHGAWKATL